MPACAKGFLGFSGDRNKERPFLHVKPAFKTQDCPWYDRGFCKHDLLCKYQHVCRTKCTNYLAGFCLEGPRCQFAHLSSSPWVPYVLLPGNPASPAPWQECLPPHPQKRPHESGAAHCLGLRCWSGACATGQLEGAAHTCVQPTRLPVAARTHAAPGHIRCMWPELLL
ncbi:hypothetical protein R6Z07M_011226 [Ovis aries]